MKLNELSLSIVVGIPKFQETQNENGDLIQTQLISGHNLQETGLVENQNLKTAFIDSVLFEKRKLKGGDVVFLSKGSNIRAALVTSEQAKRGLIASAVSLVITLDQSQLLSEVLVVYLNSEKGQELLKNMSRGATITHIPLKVLKELEIPVPSFAIQKKIAQVFQATNETLIKLDALRAQQIKTNVAIYQNLFSGKE